MDKIDEFLGKIMRGENTTSDDIKVPTTASVTLPIGSTNIDKLRVPSGQRVTYSAEDDGIREVIDTVDQFGDSMYTTTKLVLSKEVFIAAYNTYIKGETK